MPTSAIHSIHEAAGARFTEFGGWTMPLQYSGVLDEHAAVREAAGVFDVSHLGRFEVSGAGATDVLLTQLCNDVTKIEPGRAQYTMALNDEGGVEDDIIVWRLAEERYWVMPNGTNSADIEARFAASAPESVEIADIRSGTTLLAVQGPAAPDVLSAVLETVPGRFRVVSTAVDGISVWAAGTGYTGERGAEICVPSEAAADVWDAFVAAGAKPCGLGARDTLRLEMGYPLWGQDLDPTTTPLEAGLGWVVAWDHDFVGKQALEEKRSPVRKLVAFTTEGRAIPRVGYPLTSHSGTGTVSSGNFSPTLGHGIGMGYVAPPPEPDEQLAVVIRGTSIPAAQVELPFIDR
ncbi:MAG: glycine cleavage system aminomethyltransferase GcvT [Deltaproteobacteria bacterium]|jgi:aminomethyltransferase|nr:glycine cleavage system aminomethyltransferase GcvT [Deltaproteobacteria bacterium]